MKPIISIQQINKSYENIAALKDINLEIGEAELFGFIGPDGAGKSTLFRILASLLLADSGQIELAGLDVEKDYKELRTILGYMPGKFSLYQDLSVEENLNFFAGIFNTTIKENYHLIKDIYEQIEPFKKRKAGDLSGGMKQKLALSCALIHKPTVLLLDEPTTGVDAVSRIEFWDMLDKLKAQGITILVSTPYMDEAARCDRIALIQKGEIMQIDKPENVVDTFRHHLYGVKAKDMYALVKLLRTHPACHSAYLFGECIHLSSSNKINEKELIAFLEKHQMEEIEISTLKAEIEDSFMDLMSDREKTEAS
ncbi:MULTISPECIES: ABC transporter ATP-binding protein [unclassified Lentimicrobium]|uniref:ABC transporter ATP-binding protein n=1 Tax=unclassified Lentimicrobium TaxID=2677434 RepID=UPI001553FB11|nr:MULTISPECIES: ABC transporter ATP-binding protein [unclassified Lentimicrobium]NPD46788.1 ABC transporter ATP-binding protein [Lentimicrobium sp. S6]NPD85591.1 ABC transporter ATP-binding protein [Lentimicrobium sp. L6]